MSTRATGVFSLTIRFFLIAATLVSTYFVSVLPAQADVPRAYAGIVVDAKTGNTLYSYAADSLRYPASVTKVMTLYMLFIELKSGRMTMNTRLNVSQYASEAVPTKLYVRAGSTIKVEDAIKALVTLSANDVSRVIAENIAGTESRFAERMTQMARSLGMNRTTYANASGLPNSRQVTTVRDQTKLAMAMYQHFPEYYGLFSTRSFTYNGKTHGNHNRLLGENGVDGLKTGYIRAAGYNLLTSARKNGRHIVVAGFGFSSGASRNAKVRELVAKYITRSRRGDYWAQAQIPYTGGQVIPGNVFAVAANTPVIPMPRPADRMPTALQAASALTSEIAVASLGADQQPLALVAPRPAEPAQSAINSPNAQVPPPLDLIPQSAIQGSVQPGLSGSPTPRPRPLDVIGQWLSDSFSAATGGIDAPPLPVGVANLAPPANIGSAGIDPNSSGSISPAPVSAAPSVWVVQVGAAPNENAATQLIDQAKTRLSALGDYRPYVEKFENVGQTFFRARFSGFADRSQAVEMCNRIKQSNMSCLAVQS